jgi:alpha-L-fucosidase
MAVPSYLAGYEGLYARDPHAAALAWFREARFGLFLHYGLYSLLGRGEWVMYNERIPVAEYEKLRDKFTAEKFDAEAIVELAVAAGMRYVNITTRHHDSFCLFRTRETDFQSLNSPAQRDLVGELAAACAKRGVGLFLYYSYGADWRHPYFHPREVGVSCARPPYKTPDPAYLFQRDADFRIYMDFVHSQLRELLTQYGPIAGIWFDLISAYYYRPDLFPVAETYAMIRELQPQCLISFKQGVTGDEDFMSQELTFEPLHRRLKAGGASEEAVALSDWVWERNRGKWNEICTILQDKWWGYVADVGHRNSADVLRMLANARANRCNLLVNTGPLPDGSIHPADEATLQRVGQHIADHGYPEGDADQGPVLPPKKTGAQAE